MTVITVFYFPCLLILARPYALHLITSSQSLDATACSILISAYGKASKWREVMHFLSPLGDGILVVSLAD